MRALAALLFVCCLSSSADALLFRAGAPPSGPPPVFSYNTMFATPFMGWSTWEQVGGGPTQAYVTANSDALVSTGLVAAGYKVVRPDDGWSDGNRDGNGNLLPNGNFTDMKALADHIKANGEIPMAYTDAGTTGCGWNGGSGGNYVKDLTQFFITWGYQGVMFDSCGIYAEGIDDKVAYYNDILPAINQVGVPAFMEVAPASYQPYIGAFEYGPYTATTWWNGGDLYGEGCTAGGAAFSNVMQIFWGSNSHPGTTGPYHFAKNSILLVGSAALTTAEQTTQFALTSIMSAPLEIGCDVRNLTAPQIALLKNSKVISVDQDPWALSAIKLNYTYANQTEVYAKWVSTSGEREVLMINENTVPENITVTFADIGVTGTANVYDILNQTSLGTASTTYTASNVPAHSVVYLDLTGFTENPFLCYAFGAGGQTGTTAGTNCTWQADHNSQYGTGGFHEGTTQGVGNAINTSGVTNPAPQNIYQNARLGVLFPVTGSTQCPFSYNFWNLVPGATYKIRLHFSENWDTAAGQRKFNVNLYNGVTDTRVETDFDVYAAAGAQYKAVVKEYLEAAPHGDIAVIFSNGSAGCPMLSGAEAIKQ